MRNCADLSLIIYVSSIAFSHIFILSPPRSIFFFIGSPRSGECEPMMDTQKI